ncbi:MAG: YbhB/YbcL family Raf kinase inhibitor-like protein [Candidatus Eremiobacteraeota bacterium]|nr:YbhB/YbcL family Raf kinase inhibitor-like protein [Candidatus Eremiobacteraeota bacterium]
MRVACAGLVVLLCTLAPSGARAAFTLESTTFAPGATLPLAAVFPGCHGKNVSPELHWSGAPSRTLSYVLTMYDPDAAGGWWHWELADIPASAHGLREGGTSGIALTNSFGHRAYDGPCPPLGKVHRYVFTLYALSLATIGSEASWDGPQLLEHLVRGIVLGHATLVGRYKT